MTKLLLRCKQRFVEDKLQSQSLLRHNRKLTRVQCVCDQQTNCPVCSEEGCSTSIPRENEAMDLLFELCTTLAKVINHEASDKSVASNLGGDRRCGPRLERDISGEFRRQAMHEHHETISEWELAKDLKWKLGQSDQ